MRLQPLGTLKLYIELGVLDVIGMNTAEVDTDSKPNKSKNLFEVRKSNLTGLISLLRQNIFEAGKKTD